MEIRARYLLIGAFTAAVVLAVFAFVYWMENTGGLSARATYKVQFKRTVAGLQPGSAVLFNGVRVGEVTGLALDPGRPNIIEAEIAIDAATPVRRNTTASIDFQGLTGAPAIALFGVDDDAPPFDLKGSVPVLVAEDAAGQTLSQAARDALKRVERILTENEAGVRDTISNLKTFTDALARNSDKVDGIVAGLERMTGGGSRARERIFDLDVPREFPALKAGLPGQIVVPDPTIPISLDSQKITVLAETGRGTLLEDGRWPDSVAKLMQAKVVQAFENADYGREVSRPADGLNATHQLLIDIRHFEIVQSPKAEAVVDFTAKILNGEGQISHSRSFRFVQAYSPETDTAAVAAMNAAFSASLVELVTWTAGSLAKSN